MTRIIILGTGAGPVSRRLRSQPANLLIVDGKPYLIDAGAGVVRQLAWAGYRPDEIRTIFITHHHLDHTAGLEPLIAMSWANANLNGSWNLPPVQIYGPPATRYLVRAALDYLSVSERIFAASGMTHPSAGMFVAHDITRAGQFYDDGTVRVRAVENTHYHFKPGSAPYRYGDKSYSYRFDTPDRSVVFTGDTGPSEAVTKIATGADVLVSEVVDWQAVQKWPGRRHAPKAIRDARAFHFLHEHLTSDEVGKMAAKAHVGAVLLTHFSPGLDSETDMSRYTAGVRRYYAGPVIAAKDLMEY